MAAFIGIRRPAGVNPWEACYILAPVAVLVFMASLRYAFGGESPMIGSAFREIGSILRDWSPFLLFLLAYEAFQSGIWSVLLPGDRDAELLSVDRALFGETPAFRLQGIVRPALTDLLAMAYLLHLVLPPVLAFLLYRSHRRLFRAFLLAVLVSGVLASAGYVLVPAIGPGFAYPEAFRVPLKGVLYVPATGILDLARAPRDVFPSLHVGISTIALWYAVRWRRAGWLALPFVILNWLSTLYLRYHYLVDVFAGWATAALAIASAGWLLRLETLWRRPGTPLALTEPAGPEPPL